MIISIPKDTVMISSNGIKWVRPDKLAQKDIRYTRDKDGNYWRARRQEKRHHNNDPRFTFASVTKAHIDHMAQTGLLK